MVVHPFKPSTREEKAEELCDFEVSLIYIESSMPVRAIP